MKTARGRVQTCLPVWEANNPNSSIRLIQLSQKETKLAK